jgi:hypothetical protein
MTSVLLVAQRVDGVERGRPYRGTHAEDDALRAEKPMARVTEPGEMSEGRSARRPNRDCQAKRLSGTTAAEQDLTGQPQNRWPGLEGIHDLSSGRYCSDRPTSPIPIDHISQEAAWCSRRAAHMIW